MENKQYHLYEWEWEALPYDTDIEAIKGYLASVWHTRKIIDLEEEINYDEEYQDDIKRYKQGFVRFDGKNIGAKNYVGFIQYNGIQINIYPKVFKQEYNNPSGHQGIIMQNILEWLSLSSRIKFPFADISYNQQKVDNFLDPFIFIFSEVTSNRLQLQPYQRFEEVTEQTAYLKGRLALNEYISQSLVRGNYHKLYSTYDSFEYNNKFNQIVKHVSKLLLSFTENEHSIQRLQNILFLLDEVDDCTCTEADCNTIVFNRIYDGWESILNMCKMFLTGSSVKDQDNNKPNYCFLVPMELIFEEYIAAVLKKEFAGEYNIKSQKSDLYLVHKPYAVFNLQHDIYIKNNISEHLIIDTKYKIRSKADKNNKKKGVSQADMYQMVSYAYRRGCNKVLLVFPNTNIEFEKLVFTVVNGWNQDETINVHIIESPFWNTSNPSQTRIDIKNAFNEIFIEINKQTIKI